MNELLLRISSCYYRTLPRRCLGEWFCVSFVYGAGAAAAVLGVPCGVGGSVGGDGVGVDGLAVVGYEFSFDIGSQGSVLVCVCFAVGSDAFGFKSIEPVLAGDRVVPVGVRSGWGSPASAVAPAGASAATGLARGPGTA